MQDSEDSKEKLDEIVKRATLNQFIPVRDLASIMAEEEGYLDILPHLWKFYQCDIDYKIITTVFYEISIDPVQTVVREITLNTFQDRCCAWRELLKRWVGIMFDERLKDNGIMLDESLRGKLMSWKRANLKPIPYLDVYQYYDKPDRPQLVEIFSRDCSDFLKIEDLKDYIKDIEEVLHIRFPLPNRLYPDLPYEDRPPQDQRVRDPSEDAPEKPASGNTDTFPINFFGRTEGLWKITFEGESVHIADDLKGFQDIQFLLTHPGNRYDAMELQFERQETETKFQNYAEMGKEEMEKEDLRISRFGSLGYIPSKKDRENLKNLLNELEIARDLNNQEEEAKIMEMIRVLQGKLQKNPAKNASDAVRNRINRAIQRITKENESIGKYLDRFIDRGSTYAYTPLEPTHWETA